MLKMLGMAENISSIIPIAVMLVLLLVYFFMSANSRKKGQEEAMKMINELKKGDKIVTNAGIYGEIVSMKETDEGKIVTIKTGDNDGKRESYISINARVIIGIDKKKDLVLDANGEVVDPEKLREETLKELAKEGLDEKPKTKKKATKKSVEDKF